jgi:glycerate kinase
MRILLAFDKFKDALTAREACQVAAQAIASVQPDWEIDTAPLADGGDGFCDTLTGVAQGDFHSAKVTDPLGKTTQATYGIVSKDRLQESAQKLLNLADSTRNIAVIEMAESSGIALTPIRNRSPWIATSAGLGDTIAAAVKRGAQAAVIGLGGSATHDLALGALQRLGFRFRDANTREIVDPLIPNLWPQVTSIDTAQTRLPEGFEMRLACDVENPLLGAQGAAAVFGPQKGLETDRFNEMESATRRLATMLCESSGKSFESMDAPGAGAAGGAAFGLKTGLGATIVSGYELVKAWIGLEPKFNSAECIVTGEGRFDASSLQGKGPGALALETLAARKRLAVFAGSLGRLDPNPFAEDSLKAISPPNMPLEQALPATRENLTKALQYAFV